jgi:hypothetical protein
LVWPQEVGDEDVDREGERFEREGCEPWRIADHVERRTSERFEFGESFPAQGLETDVSYVDQQRPDPRCGRLERRVEVLSQRAVPQRVGYGSHGVGIRDICYPTRGTAVDGPDGQLQRAARSTCLADPEVELVGTHLTPPVRAAGAARSHQTTVNQGGLAVKPLAASSADRESQSRLSVRVSHIRAATATPLIPVMADMAVLQAAAAGGKCEEECSGVVYVADGVQSFIVVLM